ncbi:hypothetical protein PC9H_011475 [Pleurotus ostreatus]|uniref:Uncharacterized protein n=1 Tax=Pleurotus ostreatus TaxID=5322 RepID=A0A8H7DMS8_PLEOS|nr:uncharacterized protein PC9H_011475 [Pleurotus ostreatus]KAF7420956.1 hypothetical protein PC9H_011475 [Pleurotus ostreatus]
MDSSTMDVDETIMAALDTPTYDDDNDPLVRYNAEINSKILVALCLWEGVLTLPWEVRSRIAGTVLRIIFDVVSGYPGSLISPSLLSDFEMQMIPERFRPILVQTLYEAWQARDFKRLRNLEFLREPEVPATPDKRETLLHESFNLPYIGNVPEHLLSVIDSMRNNEQSYAPILPMIQSSGMGKTRALYEIGKKRIVIHCCFRENDSSVFMSYPPPDVALRDYLLKAPSPQDNEGSCKAYIQAIFYALFKSVLAVIDLVKRDNDISHRDVMRYFRRSGSSNNSPVPLGDTQDITQTAYLAIQNHFKILFDTPHERRAFYDHVIFKILDMPLPNTNQLTETAREMFEAVELHKDHFPVILALDEVHVLFNDKRGSTQHSIYSRLKSVLADLGQRIGTVVLSTATFIPLVAPSKEIAPSARERAGDLFLPAPYTELSFDVHCRSHPLSKNLSLNDIGTLKQVSIFGRPLWQSMVNSHFSMELPGEAVQLILNTVISKLTGQQFNTSLPDGMNAPALAVLCTRILLDLSPGISTAQNFVLELIRSHLRVVYSIQEDREVIISGSSSEPLVAEAAAIVMNSDRSASKPMAVWRILAQYVTQGLMGQGDAGELLGRTISIMAMDRAISSCPTWAELKYQTPIEVNKYFHALLTHEQWEALRISVPANFSMLGQADSARSFEDAFRGAYVHFSHYSRARDSSPLNINYLWALWIRGVAIQCHPTQEFTDRVLPIYFSSRGTIQPASMSCILEQDKTSPKLTPSSVATQSAQELKIFNGGTQLPYITVLNCYAGSSLAGQPPRYPQPRATRHPNQNEEAPRYEIVLHSLDAYIGLGAHNESISAMINGSTSSLFEHHPRKTPTALSLLHALQPYLDDDPSTTQWFGH